MLKTENPSILTLWLDQNNDIPAAQILLLKNLLNIHIEKHSSPSGKSGAIAQIICNEKPLDLCSLDSAGILIAAQSGPVLSDEVLNQIENFLAQDDPQDIFLAVKSSQIELDLLEELRFTHGFQTCHVGQADHTYLRRVLTQQASNLLLPLSPAADLDRVIAQLRRYRGPAFTECDFEHLLHRTAERIGKRPAETADLLFHPCRSQVKQGREARRLFQTARRKWLCVHWTIPT